MQKKESHLLLLMCSIFINVVFYHFLLSARNKVQSGLLVFAIAPFINLVLLIAAGYLFYRYKQSGQKSSGWLLLFNFCCPILCYLLLLWLSGFNHTPSGF
ncbi:MAG: hypothetical protein JNJ86_16825 [Chitinophagaceae bacterium]|nr:hypothetical protein [Chitinophagaceae bacterium]